MAEQSVHDVVNQTMSVGAHSPSDAHDNKPTRNFIGGEITTPGTNLNIQEDDGSEQDVQPSQGDSVGSAMTNGQTNGNSSRLQSPFADPAIHADSNARDADFDGTISRNHSVGDLSPISDIENHKTERSSTYEDPKNQDAAGAGRKPASFKPVSFAKYSAAKVAGINAAGKSTADKAMSSSASISTSLQQGSRPRLVAKSTSGLRDSGSKTFKPGGRNGAGVPDPMQVWNKNRPAPPPSTKHLTDEELKQQYGIHMTSRIEADGENKEAKWADIDDDEDDWAPDTIEWADGTKVTLNHTSNMPLLQEAIRLERPPGEQRMEAPLSRPKAPQVVTSVGPNATVLKLGASAERQQAQKATTSHNGPAERPTLPLAKSPAPVPAKSPWAPLPPVDKASPITINPQVSVPLPNRQGQVSQSGQSPSIGMAPSPAKEISADDFNRSWRDSQPDQPRELFMPNSGKYEAVNENRRRGSRNDQNFRAAALLQRPAPSDQHTPAEPSPAFQTSRMSSDQERSSWHRRRASSIQSGGSGQFGRRPSVSRSGDIAQVPPEMPQLQRRSSQAGTGDAVASSRGVHVQQNLYPATASSAAGLPGRAADAALAADQKRLMQESARLAVQRRQEVEQKEEAAKKERIRLKLERLGPPPDLKSRDKDVEQKVAAVAKPEEPALQISSPPKPPVPEASGEPKQYGMMKVHHPDNVKKFGPPVEKPETDSNLQDGTSPPKLDQGKNSPPSTNATGADAEPTLEFPVNEIQNKALPAESNVQAWKIANAVDGTMPGWGSRNHHPPPATSNLWGSPSHDKALGNGTFDQSLTGMPARDLSMRNNSQPPNWFNGRHSSHERSPQPPHIPLAPPEGLESSAPFPSPEQRPIAANSEADSLQPIAKPLPIGPPQPQSTNHRWQQPSNIRSGIHGVAAWNNFHAVAAREDRAETERFQREIASNLEEEARTGTRKTPQYTFNETWKQVETGDQAGDRQIASVAKGGINSPFPTGHSYGAPATNLNGDRAMNGLPIRGSRFFPTEARRAVTYSHPGIPRSASPPPAEEVGSLHPAYEGDSKRPVINFPVPKAVVKLPKLQQEPSSTPAPGPVPRTFAAAAASQPPAPKPSSRTVSQPLSSTPNWQHRFNDLFGRTSPPKKQVLAVASSSRDSLDVVSRNVLAAVSLPPKRDARPHGAGEVTSRDAEEQEDLFEDREAASRPLVHLPRDVPENLWHPGRTPQLRPRTRYFKVEIDPFSISLYDGTDDQVYGNKGKDIIFYIHLPGSAMSTRKTMPRKAGSDGFLSKGPRSHNSNKHKKGPPRSREYSGSFQNMQQGNRGTSSKSTPTANGSVPTPRSGFSHNSTNTDFRGGHFASAGIAH